MKPDASGLGGQCELVLDWTGNGECVLPLIYVLLLLPEENAPSDEDFLPLGTK